MAEQHRNRKHRIGTPQEPTKYWLCCGVTLPTYLLLQTSTPMAPKLDFVRPTKTTTTTRKPLGKRLCTNFLHLLSFDGLRPDSLQVTTKQTQLPLPACSTFPASQDWASALPFPGTKCALPCARTFCGGVCFHPPQWQLCPRGQLLTSFLFLYRWSSEQTVLEVCHGVNEELLWPRLLLMCEAAVGMAGKCSKEKPPTCLLVSSSAPLKLPAVPSGEKVMLKRVCSFYPNFPNAMALSSRNISCVCTPLN